MKRGTPGFVGERLKEAREARGLTAISLSEIVGVSRQAISQYENDQQTPRPEVMEKIEHSLNLPTDFFSRPVTEQPKTSKIFYRSMSTATKTARVRVGRRYEWLQNIVAYVDRFVTLPSVRFPNFDVPQDPTQLSQEDIEDLASKTRKFWGMGEGPISNVAWLLENNGSVVTRGMMGADKLDAFSEWYERSKEYNTPFIFLGADKNSGARSRFDAAHELGHLVLHRNIHKKYIKRQSTFKLIEDQAHRFGSAFLLPPTTFANDVSAPNLDTFRALKLKWKVSAAAMIYRSAELQLIDKEHAQRLWRSRARRGWIQREPLDDQLPVEKPRLLYRVFRLLIDEGVQSRAEIKAALPYSTSDIEELAGLPPGFLEERPAPISLKTFSKKRFNDTYRRPDTPAEILEFKYSKDSNSG